jgi:hypothetical protein
VNVFVTSGWSFDSTDKSVNLKETIKVGVFWQPF